MAPKEQRQFGLGPGDRLGDYQLLVQVGAGGMGRVFAARRVGAAASGSLVAIKTGLGESGGSAEFERLFVDEARIASLIEHPNVLPVHELGEEAGVLYLVMEWCDGATLRDLIDALPDHRLPLEVAVRIVADVAGGLHAAHELVDGDGEPLQVVHRDVSPQNVLLWSGGHVKVSDFGVAKARGQLHRPTETGEVKGKLSYMAPEQVTSPRIDRRADIFGLGCVLYEATVGQRPYHGGDALSTLYQLLERETVPPRALRPDYPADLEAIVLRALAKAPEGRYSTAEELREALEAWLHHRRALVTASSIAELMREALGETMDRLRQRVSETIARLDSAQPLPESPLPAAGVETNEPTVRPIRGAAERVSDPGGRRSRVGVGSRQDRWTVFGLALAAVTLAAVVILVAARHPASATGAAASAAPIPIPTGVATSAELPSSGPPRVASAVITIRTEPPDAELRVDAQTQTSNPLVLRVPADRSSHSVVASAPGYAPSATTVVYDGDRDVVVRLEKVASHRNGSGPRRPPTPPRTGPSATAPTAGPVRPLDEENPFARRP